MRGLLWTRVWGGEPAVVDLSGSHTAIISVRNSDGSPAAGKKFRLTYVTPGTNDLTVSQGTGHETVFHWEPVKLIATVAAGRVPPDGTVQLGDLAGEPRRFTLMVGETGSGNYDTLQGILPISFPDPLRRTNEFTLNLSKFLETGDAAPDFSIRDVFTDSGLTKSTFKGKLLVLKFWTTTCAPCQPEIAELNQLMARRHKDWDDRVAVVAVSLDDDREKLIQRIRGRGWTALRHAWTSPKENGSGFDSAIARDYGIISIPYGFVVHPSGVILWRNQLDQVEAIIDHALNSIQTKDEIETFLRQVDKARLSKSRGE